MTINIQDPNELSWFGWDTDPKHALNHTRAKRTSLKRTLPPEKSEQLMRLACADDMTPSLNDDDSGYEVHEEGMNGILTCFFGDGNNDHNNDHMGDINNDSNR